MGLLKVNTTFERWTHWSYAWTDQYIFEHGHRGPIEEILVSPDTWRELAVSWDYQMSMAVWVEPDGKVCNYDSRVPIEFGRFTLRRQFDPKGALAHRRWWTEDMSLPEEDGA